MKIYLDNCCFNRPYDDQSRLSVFFETQAKLYIQFGILVKKHQLVWSSILDYENKQNPYEIRRNNIQGWRKLAVERVRAESDVITCANELKKLGAKTKEALHLASAIKAKCDVFITVDKKLQKIKVNDIMILNPIGFLEFEKEA